MTHQRRNIHKSSQSNLNFENDNINDDDDDDDIKISILKKENNDLKSKIVDARSTTRSICNSFLFFLILFFCVFGFVRLFPRPRSFAREKVSRDFANFEQQLAQNDHSQSQLPNANGLRLDLSNGSYARYFWFRGDRFVVKSDASSSEQETLLFCGAIHYFRLHPNSWKDRLLKLKAAGFNCVETYIPWNFHQPQKNKFKFDNQHDIEKYLTLANELALFVIVRPGPYICSEWEMGGLPSFLLQDPNMQLRSTYEPFLVRKKKKSKSNNI